MEEANTRVLRPHRKYLPSPSWFRFRSNMAALNAYLVGLIRARWQARLAGQVPEGGDILDRILAAIQVRGLRVGGGVGCQGTGCGGWELTGGWACGRQAAGVQQAARSADAWPPASPPARRRRAPSGTARWRRSCATS
jgi:hypothetical protein